MHGQTMELVAQSPPRGRPGRGDFATRVLICSAVALLFHAGLVGAQQDSEWDRAPDDVVAARSEARCAANHAGAGAAPRCRNCGVNGRPADSPRSHWATQDPGGDCRLCCDEMKEARSSAVEADGDNTADESDADHDGSDIARDTAMLLADCCEGQCCEPFDGPSEENHTGRYIALAMILVVGGIAVAFHHCHRERQVTKRQEMMAEQNQQMSTQSLQLNQQQPDQLGMKGSAAHYQVEGQVMMPQQQTRIPHYQQQAPTMTMQPEYQVVVGEALPGQPVLQQSQPQQPVVQGP